MFENVSIWAILWRSRACNSKVTGHIWPECELIQDFMPLLVTCKFAKDQINNECASMETFYKSMEKKNQGPRAIGLQNEQKTVRSGQNLNLSKILCLSFLPASLNKVHSKVKVLAWRHRFPHYQLMGAFCCHGNKGFDWICPNCLCSLSPNPVMLHMKFDQNWLTGLGNILVRKCAD